MLASIEARLNLWKLALEAWWSAPWTGIGWGEFPFYMLINGTTYGVDRNAHNLILHFLAETGIIGTFLLVYGLVHSLPNRYVFKYSPIYGILAIQMVHSMVEFPMFYMHFMVIAAIMLGMIHEG